MQVNINEIQKKRRIRKDLGDLSPLMESIKKHGLINPVLLTRQKELIAGERRLEAVKRLGWKTIPAQLSDTPLADEKLELEIDENLYRKSLSSDELTEAYARLDSIRHPHPVCRFFRKIASFFTNIFYKIFKRVGKRK